MSCVYFREAGTWLVRLYSTNSVAGLYDVLFHEVSVRGVIAGSFCHSVRVMEVVEGGTNCGKALLVKDGETFRRVYTYLNGCVRWRCTNGKCPAKIILNVNNEIKEYRGDHNHDVSDKDVIVQKVRASCKRKAVEDVTSRPGKLIARSLQENAPQSTSTLHFSDLKLIREAMYRERRKIIPNLPTCLSEVHEAVSTLKPVSSQKEPFVLVNNIESSFIVFGCESNLKVMCEAETLFLDGTFNFCTKFFTQLFTLHCLMNGHYVPVVFCLLPNKTKETYVLLFNSVICKCKELGLTFHPDKVVADFEIAIHEAIKSVWSEGVVLLGCRFHLGQAWFRKLQNLGLASVYKNRDSPDGTWLRHIFGLSYLPPQEVGECFAIEMSEDKPTNSVIDLFSDYLVDTYISEDATFPPSIWAEQSSSISHTTNACESFHSKFNSLFYSTHPDIYTTIDVLKTFQSEIYLKINGISKRPYKRKHVLEKQERIEKWINLFQTGKCTRIEYVRNISYMNMPFIRQ